MQVPPLLFLDIDGVLNTRNPWPNGCGRFEPAKVKMLNALLNQFPTLGVVVSSSWRHFFDEGSLTWLLKSHGVDLRHPVYGITERDTVSHKYMKTLPDVTDVEKWRVISLECRAEQIDMFLSLYDEPAHIVIDDLPLEINSGFLIKTEPSEGLTWFHIGQAVSMLKSQLK